MGNSLGLGAAKTSAFIDEKMIEQVHSKDDAAIKENFEEKKEGIPLDVVLAHFTPSSFPLTPYINARKNELCVNSWKFIACNDETDADGTVIAGISVFYNEFYSRLKMFDINGKFEDILLRHTKGDNVVAAKGAILLRIIKYVLLIVDDTPQIRNSIDTLGRSHTSRGIRPWQYSIFVEVLLATISSRMGTGATNDIMEAWVNLFAYMLTIMLPPAINGQVKEKEFNMNVVLESKEEILTTLLTEIVDKKKVRMMSKLKEKKIINTKEKIPDNVRLAHYTPSSFPISPFITKERNQLCTKSWQTIVSSDIAGPDGAVIAGITVFYDEFYHRLAEFDSSHQFEDVLAKHAQGQNKVAAKGAIIIRIIKYVLLISEDNKKTRNNLVTLGRSHTSRGIRPWQYSIFVEVLLATISSRMGTGATNDIMEAWVNLFAYMLQGMLPYAINGLVDEKEYNVKLTDK